MSIKLRESATLDDCIEWAQRMKCDYLGVGKEVVVCSATMEELKNGIQLICIAHPNEKFAIYMKREA